MTGSGTDVGKTYITCRLLRSLKAKGHSCRAIKPVASGFDATDPAAADTGRLLEAMEYPLTAAQVERVSPWRFATPLSPDMAAAREGRAPVPFDTLVAYCKDQIASGTTLIEGIGGVMVPLDDTHTVLDWIAALRIPVVLVAGSYVGTLSHTLTAMGMLEARDLEIAAVVVSESLDSAARLDETVSSLAAFLPATRVFGVPRNTGAESDDALVDYLRERLGARS